MKTEKIEISPDGVKYYSIAEITLAIEADAPITDATFEPKFKAFEVPGPGKDCIRIIHHISFPKEIIGSRGRMVGQKGPWSIYQRGNDWVYISSDLDSDEKTIYQMAVFNKDYSKGNIYHPSSLPFDRGDMPVLTVYPTDQIILAPILASRDACFFHSSGMILDGKGYLFIGHSEAGKSTMVKIMRNRAEILCDERNIVRRWDKGFRIHGTWSHGEMPDISPNSAPLRGIFLLVKDTENRIVRVTDKKEIVKNLLDCMVKPYRSNYWWDNALRLSTLIAAEVPFSVLHFDTSGKVMETLESFQG